MWLFIAPAMASDGMPALNANSPWWLVVLAFLPTVGGGALAAWRYRADRGDKSEIEHLTREQQLMRDLDAQRAAADLKASNLADRTLAALNRAELESSNMRTQRDAAWAEGDKQRLDKEDYAEAARRWERVARRLRHEMQMARSKVNLMRAAAALPPLEWSDDDMPTAEKPE